MGFYIETVTDNELNELSILKKFMFHKKKKSKVSLFKHNGEIIVIIISII